MGLNLGYRSDGGNNSNEANYDDIVKGDASIISLKPSTIKKYYENYSFEWLLIYQMVPLDVIQNNVESFDNNLWHFVSEYQNLSERFIIKYSEKINWVMTSQHQVITPYLAIKYEDKIDWWRLSSSMRILDEVIDRYCHKIDWDILSYMGGVSEYVLVEYADKLCLEVISERNSLSESVRSRAKAIMLFKGKF